MHDLECAVMRPQMATWYEGASFAEQIALLISGIARRHAFLTGNKRAAMVTGEVCARLNGNTIGAASMDLALHIAAAIAHPAWETAAAEFTRLRTVVAVPCASVPFDAGVALVPAVHR